MSFNIKTLAEMVAALVSAIELVGCGQDEEDPNYIKVGMARNSR